MAQPSKDSGSSLRQKLGSILGLVPPRSAPLPQKTSDEQEHSTFFTADVLRELESGVPLPQRVRSMKELHEIVASKRLEEHAVQAIWQAIRDMVEPSQPTEIRQAALVFTRALISGQFDNLGILRAHFFHVLQNHTVKEDTPQRLEILRALTHNGRNTQYMEEAIGPFLVQWMPEVVTLGRAVEFLSLLVNFVHYNAAYLDEEVLVGLVQLTCVVANKSTEPNIIRLCLDFLNAVVCYSSLPPDALQSFVTTLCHTLNIERFSKKSLEVMLRLLGTHLGRTAIYTMCTLIQERSQGQGALLLRGAVFYISMSMWGIRRVESLELSFASVLPSIRQAVLSGHTIVVYEVALSVGRLVRKHAPLLHPLEWDLIYSSLAAIQDHLDQLLQEKGEPGGLPSNSLVQSLRELFQSIEDLYEDGRSIGPAEKFFELLERGIDTLPVRSVLTLVSYRTRVIDPTAEEWVEQVVTFMEKFYRRDSRAAIRTEALNFLGTVLAENSLSHESQLMERAVIPFLQFVADDPDPDIRCRAVQLLVHLVSEASSEWGAQLLAIINTVLQRGLEEVASSEKPSGEDPKLPDSKAAVFGLTLAFKTKLFSFSPLAAQIFDVLITLVQQHYQENCHLPTACVMRINIFNCFLNLCANEAGQLGYRDNSSTQFSPFFICCQSEGYGHHTSPPSPSSPLPEHQSPPSPFSPTIIDYRKAFSAVLACLRYECEWEVLIQVLHHLRGLLQDRTLTLAGLPDLSPLCLELCHMVEEQSSRLKQLRNVSSSWSRSDLASHVCPVLSLLPTYPTHLNRKAQHTLVCCLEVGLVGKSAQTCVSALSICALELQATMTRLLPRVLYRMSQVVATPTMALPVLGFLWGLIPVPALYSAFSEQQYFSVFAIALPYTAPDKYSPYVIALAHHVIAMWFVQCRLHYRPSVAKFIHKSLATNLSMSYRPGVSSSPGRGGAGEGEGGRLFSELTEVCLDMMTRYTFSNLSSLPSRSPGADFLISGGPSKTWLVGHSLVTVTTSGLGGGRVAACRRCAAIRVMGKVDPSNLEPPEAPQQSSLCSCWCQGWAEIKVRRPTGNIAWLMRLQNRLQALYTLSDTDWGLLAVNYPFEAEPVPSEEGGEGLGTASARQQAQEDRPEEEVSKEEAEIASLSSKPPLNGMDGESATQLCMKIPEEEQGTTGVERSGPLLEAATHTVRGTTGVERSGPLLEAATHTVRGTTGVERSGPLLEAAGESESRERSVELCIHETSQPLSEDGWGLPTPVPSQQSSSHAPLRARTSPARFITSQSWSERADSAHRPLSPLTSSCSAFSSLELLPPLLSYDVGEDEFGRSPALHGSLLSEQEQLHLHASASQDSTVVCALGSPGGSPTVVASDASSEEEEEEGEMDRDSPAPPGQEPEVDDVEEGGGTPPRVPSRPRLHHQSASMPEESPRQPTLLVQETSSPLLRRQSVPLPPFSSTPSSSPATGRRRLLFAQNTSPTPSEAPPPRPEDSELFCNPSFIFLQLYHSCCLGPPSETPLLLPSGETMERALKVLDHIPPYDTHKIGVVYVNRKQTQEGEILANTFGSSRYVEFLRGLGQLLCLADCSPDTVYLGGLDRSGTDGQFAYFFQDHITQVVFHVATLMPTHPSDPHCSNKKLHIGNDYVTIVYNDSQQPYTFGTIKGQFNFAEVVVEPLPGGMNRVTITAKKGLEEVLQGRSCLISDLWLPVLVRQKALQANLASLVHVSESVTERYPSNWLGRLRQIKRMREKSLGEQPATGGGGGGQRSSRTAFPFPDFSLYS